MGLSDRIKLSEGLRLLPYTCPTGHLTIGYGHNLERPISQRAAQVILDDDLAAAREDAAKIPEYRDLDPVRRDVLVDMTYNMGLPAVMQFHGMRAALAAQNWQEAGREMLDSLWARQVGKRAQELSAIMVRGTS